jgi:DNA polymerase
MDKVQILQELEKSIKICKKCRLCEHAKNAVPGEGNLDSPIVFVGEAPGATEDATGRPFVGRAGKLLEKLLGEIGYKREDVWIGNIIKHRPPENRDPLPDEIAACQPYLTAQLAAIQPKLVVTLGRFAMNYFYPEGKISQDHGALRKIYKDGVPYYLYPVYHPAAALRSGEMERTLRSDFVKIPDVLRKIDSDQPVATDSGPQLGLNL